MKSAGTTTGLLFICTGNICRSPAAEGIFRKRMIEAGLAERFTVDSAGTHGYHVGEPPDTRMQAAAARRGYDLSLLRARKFELDDFRRFDLVLAMDEDNHAFLTRICKPSESHKLRMIMEFAGRFPEREVPDPYYGGPAGFERVIDMLEDASQGLLDALVLARRK